MGVGALWMRGEASDHHLRLIIGWGLGLIGFGYGVAELIAAILLIAPSFPWLGAGLALGVMGGAIMSHLTVLGIVVKDDGGLLFALAVIVALCSAVVLFIHRYALPIIGARL